MQTGENVARAPIQKTRLEHVNVEESQRRAARHPTHGWVKEDFGRFTGNNFSTFGEDALGQLYVAGTKSGTIFKVLDYTTPVTSANVLGKYKNISNSLFQ